MCTLFKLAIASVFDIHRLLFAVLITSGIDVFVPITTERFFPIHTDHIIFIALRQLGTGVVIVTALGHASLQPLKEADVAS